jgi:HSP20 family protein|tara:strand:- start:17 stop:439 length:423 start_codon:yes stop_codon:yes gene_type:complete
MTLLQNRMNSAFDILFKDAWGELTNDYVPALNSKIHYPIDIYEYEDGMKLEIACVGLNKSDIDININGDVISISSDKQKKDETASAIWYCKNITRRGFKHEYKISTRFDLSKSNANMDKGLLIIDIPFAENKKPKTLTID